MNKSVESDIFEYLHVLNAFYRYPYVIAEKKHLFVDSQTPLTPFLMLKYAP